MKRMIWTLTAIIIIATLIFSSASFSAELQGNILDEGNNKGISAASVELVELKIGVMTADDGSFIFPNIVDGKYTLRVRRAGYAPRAFVVNISGTTEKNVALTVSPYVTEEVVSIARGRQTSVDDIPGSVSVVSADDILKSNPTGISDVLAKEPGVASASDMPWGARTVIRGMSRDQVVLLVDGARVVTATALPAQFGTIAQNDVERIEVLKGPLSVLYGSGSTGGVVNVITKTGHFTPGLSVDFALNTSYESAAGGVSAYERATVSNDNFYVNISQANRKYSDYRSADGERIRNSQFQDRQTQFNAGARFGAHTFEARYQHFSVIDVGIPGGSTFPPNALATYPTSSRQLADLKWTWRPQASWIDETSLQTYYQPVVRNAKLIPNAPASVMAHPQDSTKEIHIRPESIYPDATHNVYGFRWQNVLRFQGHDVVAGLEGWQKDMVSDRTKNISSTIFDKNSGLALGAPTMMTIVDTPVPDSSQRPIGVFAEDSFKLGENLKLSLGGRIDQIHTENEQAFLTETPKSAVVMWEAFDDDDLSWSLVAGGVYTLTESVDLNLTMARSFRSPTIEERYFYGDLGGVLTVGDPELDSEKGSFIEAGVDFTLGSLRTNGQVFLNQIEDMVIKQPGGDLKGRPVDFKYVNAGKARLAGFELSADWIAHESLLLSSDISYVRGTDEEADIDLPAMPPVRAHLSARWNIGSSYWIEPVATFIGKQDKTAPGEAATAGYGLVDISAGKTLLKTGTVSHGIVIGVKNVGDKLYQDHLTVSRGYDVYGIGRSFFISWQSSLDAL